MTHLEERSQGPNSYVRAYSARVNTIAFIVLAAHIPLLGVLSHYTDRSGWTTLFAGVLLLLGPGVLLLIDRASELGAVALGAAAMGFSALTIYDARGSIESHFHVFVALGCLTVFGRVAPVLAATATIALHHVVFWLWVPEGIFNYRANLGVVLLHAGFVVAQAIPSCWIARQFGRAIRVRGVISHDLQEMTDQLALCSTTIGGSSHNLLESAETNLGNVTTAARSSAEVGRLAGTNAVEAGEALRLMHAIQFDVREASSAVDTVQAKVGSMVESSLEVSRIAKLVDEIAFQSNILALNAAIEAARSGEAGQTFAVVAAEFRQLSVRTANAAREIAVLLERGQAHADEGRASVEWLVDAFQQADDSTSSARARIDSIHQASKDQAAMVQEIHQAHEQISRVATTAVECASESRDQSTSLAEQAQILRSIVDRLQDC